MKYKVGQVFDYKYANERGHRFKIRLLKVYNSGVFVEGKRAINYFGGDWLSWSVLQQDFTLNVIGTAKSLRKLSKK